MSVVISTPRLCWRGMASSLRFAQLRCGSHLGTGLSLIGRNCPRELRLGRHNSMSRSQRGLQTVSASADTVMELPPELQKIVTAFQVVPDAKLKYQQLLVYGKKLVPLPAEDHIDDHKVRGCVSQVWVVPEVREDGKIYWKADSDSALTKGLAALLVQGLSGCTAEQIVRIPPNWITDMGLQQSLTPSRNNGFLNMFKLMQKRALELLVQQGQQGSSP